MKKYDKLYNLVYQTLIDLPGTRGSDKDLMWRVWQHLGYVLFDNLAFGNFFDKNCPTPESITRCRRKIQELHSELQAANRTRRARADKAAQKGTHIYREPAKPKAPKCPACTTGYLVIHSDFDYTTGIAVATKTYRKCNNTMCGWKTDTI